MKAGSRMVTNLPVIVTRVGGDLEKVVTEIEKYTDSNHPLERQAQIVLARIVDANPTLNTTARVSLLVDALSWHGVDQSREFMFHVDTYGIDVVHFALDYLYEVGERGHKGEQSGSLSDMVHVGLVAEMITTLRSLDFAADNVEWLRNHVENFGGLDAATDARVEDIELFYNIRSR